ncbi:MAG: hypothetical protein KKC84_02275, partial [Candidatus Omnitrophica bacterium]|nr:hypothetical protein [Candidatus Omnitrophota bacterium]
MVDRIMKFSLTVFILCVSIGTTTFAFSAQKDQPVQFFLKNKEHGVCGRETEISVFALDAYGLITRGYEGNKSADIQIKEIGGKIPQSAVTSTQVLEFKDGKAKFTLTDSEPESVEMHLVIESLKSPFPAKIKFKENLPVVSFSLELPRRGTLNEPVKARVFAVDKEGNTVVEYSQKGIVVEVTELGMQDGSGIIEPRTLTLQEGRGELVLSNSQEEELVVRVKDPRGKIRPAEAKILFALPDHEPPQITDIKMDTLAFVELTFSEVLD